MLRRWNGTDWTIYVAIILTLGKYLFLDVNIRPFAMKYILGMSIYEEINYISYGRELIYHFHHFLVILSYCIFLGYPHLYFYLAWASTVETTGLFVNYFLSNRRLFPLSNDRIVISGALMWLSFLLFRVVSIIGCLCMLLYDIISYPNETIVQISKLFVAVMVFVILSVFLLSCYWFYKMTVGIYKALKENKEVAPEPPPELMLIPLSTAVTVNDNKLSDDPNIFVSEPVALEDKLTDTPGVIIVHALKEGVANSIEV